MSDAIRRAPTASMRAISRDRFGEAEARHLLWRAGFGGTDAQIATLAEWGPERAVDHLLDVENAAGYPGVRSDAFDADVIREFTREEQRAFRLALQQGDEAAVTRFRALRESMQRADRDQMRGVQRWWLTRMIESARPLEEKMTLFWHGHFATSYRTVENSYHMFLQNQLFRSHALGNFGDLLFRIIRDPAMLKYLNNDRNFRASPNENLARELMELFALGEGQYQERDIREGARALTGYTYSGNEFIFDANRHDDGQKQILGMSGNLNGDDFVRAILARRSCSDFIATKLYRWFVSDEVPPRGTPARASMERVIRDLSGTMRRERYAIKPVLRMLFLSEHFYDRANMHVQIKSPVELVVGTVRSLHTPVRDLNTLLDAMELMGQRLFFPPNVAGWAGGRSWINTSTVFVRQNTTAFLLTGMTPEGGSEFAGRAYDPSMVIRDFVTRQPEAARNPERMAGRLLEVMLGLEIGGGRRESVARVLDADGNIVSNDGILQAMMLISAMPEYQLC